MTAAGAALADTSIFIALETARPLRAQPERIAVSVVTLGELELGVHAATDAATRARRADTLALARRADPIPITEATMSVWAALVQECRTAGIHRTVRLTDALIAATAVEHGLPLVTQDDDFEQIAHAFPRLEVLRV